MASVSFIIRFFSFVFAAANSATAAWRISSAGSVKEVKGMIEEMD